MKIYAGFSISEFLWAMLLRISCIAAIFFFISVFYENPPLMFILIVSCIIAVMLIGDDQIVVFSDKIMQNHNSIAFLLFKSIHAEYLIEDIKNDSTVEKASSSKIKIGIAKIVFTLFKSHRSAEYLIEDVKNAYTIEKVKPSKTKIGIVKIFFTLFKLRRNADKTNSIFLELNNNSTIHLSTKIGDKNTEEIINAINNLIKNKNITYNR
jgi:hypothetical protein